MLTGFGHILFVQQRPLSLLILAATLIQPYVFTSGLIALATCLLLEHSISPSSLIEENPAYRYNSLLVGLSIGFI